MNDSLESRFFLEEFDSQQCYNLLVEGLNKGDFKSALRHHLKQYVPVIFKTCNHNDLDQSHENRLTQKLIFNLFDKFICNGEPKSVYNDLKNMEEPRVVCLKVFKLGEPTYSCRTCGMDPTCVLCVDCFQNSPHKLHKYKMSTSGGGGYCDCGDLEAWKSDPLCDIHKLEQEKALKDEGAGVKLLSEDLKARMEALFFHLTYYCIQMLTLTQEFINLEEDLQPSENNLIMETDKLITMLFNDEVHTYDQVTGALKEAISCTQIVAIDIATTVDREGRCIISTGTWQECSQVRKIIQEATKVPGAGLINEILPLTVHVMSPYVVAHQSFAMKAISWMKTITDNYGILRNYFAELSMLKTKWCNTTLVEWSLLDETKMWKSARTQTRQLFMTGIFMNPTLKKQFAVIFARVYDAILKNYINDDHDHSLSAVSESIQLFTVPSLNYNNLVASYILYDTHHRRDTAMNISLQLLPVTSIARMLIEEHNLLHIISNTFINQAEFLKNTHTLDPNDPFNMRFKRSHCMLYDLRYALLSCPEPHEWTNQLRSSFLDGFRSFMYILNMMQNLQGCTRQQETHVEYEIDWEDAFTLQMKLIEVYSLFVDWCKSDKIVLEASIVIIGESLSMHKLQDLTHESITVAGHVAYCPRWNFTIHKASVHQAMTRMFAALLFCLTSHPDVQFENLLEQTGNEVLGRESLTFEASFEPCLRTVVFVSQIHAGMWKRNGMSLQNMAYYYHSVKCRLFMYDKDVLFMQIAASMFPSNEMMLRLIHGFGLTNWIRKEYDTETTHDETMKQIISMAESFLNWLIIIICERYNVGLGEVTYKDVHKYEIIHTLCIQPMTHSELLGAVVDGFEKEDCFEELVKEVATFKKPTGSSGKGLYELKEECYDLYNPYYYHYYKINKARADENVKKFLKTKGIQTDSICPPSEHLPEFTRKFQNITNLLECDVFVHMIKVVLMRSASRYSKSWSESQQERAFYLIELALMEEMRRRRKGDASFQFVAKATNSIGMTTMTPLPSLLVILEKFLLFQSSSSSTSQHVMRDQASRIRNKLLELSHSKDLSDDMQTDEPGLHTSLSGTRRLDTTSKIASDDRQHRIKTANEASKKSEKAQKRREKLLAQMAKMQRNFIKENQELFESTSAEMNTTGADADLVATESLPSAIDNVVMNHPVALGIKRMPPVTNTPRHTCILCQEDQDVLPSEKALVYCAYIQKSTVLSTDRSKPLGLKVSQYTNPLFTNVSLQMGVNTSSCGHVMHADCWKSFFEGLVQRDARRNRIRMYSHTYDVNKKEFVCPMCETLSNAVLPIIPPLSLLMSRESNEKKVNVTLDEWLDGILKTVDNSIKQERDKVSKDDSFFYVPCPLSTVTKMMAEGVATRFQILFDYIVEDNSSTFSDSIVEMVRKFCDDMFEMSLDRYNNEYRAPLTVWNTCAYSILSIENSLRDEDKPLFGSLPSKQAECICTLVRLAAITTNLFPVDAIKRHCIRILSVLSCRYLDLNTPSITDIDLFHCLVTLCFSLPALYKDDSASGNTFVLTNGINESNTLKFVLACHVLQIMIADLPAGRSVEEQEKLMEVDNEIENDELIKICHHLRSMVGLPLSTMTPSELIQHLRLSCLPFLRCSALFFHYLTGVPAPLKLFERNSEEFEIICEYLDLESNLASLFNQSKHLQDVLMEWCSELSRMLDSHTTTSVAIDNQTTTTTTTQSTTQSPTRSQMSPRTLVKKYPPLPSSSSSLPSTSSSPPPSSSVAATNLQQSALTKTTFPQIPPTSSPPFTKVIYPRRINRLVELPVNYSDLINRFSLFSCPKSNSNDESRNPSMCLVCGVVVCSQSYCCQVRLDSSRSSIVGAAMAHTYYCGAGTGLFIRIRDCQVMLLNGMHKGCFIPPPYLDEYGETDEYLRRGNPLTLCPERYRYIERLWINHQIASEISHKVETYPHHSLNTEWHTH